MSKPDDQDYLWDKSGAPDPEVARLEALLSPLAHRAPLDELRLRRKRKLPWFVIGSVLAAAAIAVIVLAWPRTPAPPADYACGAHATGFAFTSRGGSVACGGAEVPAGVLPIGGTIDTGAHEAELAIADIGSAQLSPNTRIRLEHTRPDHHQLYLEVGKMHARVTAYPPKLLGVGTPSGQVTDLGCEYTLEIDATGAGYLEVKSGLVEGEATNGRTVVVPAGARARLLPGRRASLPLNATASPELTAAVNDLQAGAPDAVEHILAAAKPSDASTIANLVRLVDDDKRRAVLDRLQVLAPAPQDMTVDEIEELDLFDMWFDEIVFGQATR